MSFTSSCCSRAGSRTGFAVSTLLLATSILILRRSDSRFSS
ncbi:Uncharacterised protein [Vibrio cholerae]|nr:Uncharacterised protein [Vibrio cholerae]